jgi:hypothetical protein
MRTQIGRELVNVNGTAGMTACYEMPMKYFLKNELLDEE